MANNTFRMPIPIGHPIYEVNNGHIEEYEVIGYRIGRMIGEDQEDYEDDYGDYDGWRIEYGRDGIEGSSPISAIGNYLFQSTRAWRKKTMENKEKPILFNTKMVRAILDGQKTCTRRVVKTKRKDACGFYVTKNADGSFAGVYEYDEDERMFENSLVPPYQHGDILYVRETFIQAAAHTFWYKADDNSWMSEGLHWHPSIHMPKEAARIWLKVTDVRVERLQDIDGKGCVKEGIEEEPLKDVGDEFVKGMFHDLWDSTIKKSDIDRYGWDANPWVWVIEFERCDKEGRVVDGR